jgi:hypothetical protein
MDPAIPTPDPNLQWLGEGECEAIMLPEQHGQDVLLLMDEGRGRREAQRRRLRITGTLGALNDAASRGWVDLSSAFERLRQTTFRASPSLLQSLLVSVHVKIRCDDGVWPAIGLTTVELAWRRGWDSNPRYGFPHARFRGEYFKPLSHLSAWLSLHRSRAFDFSAMHRPVVSVVCLWVFCQRRLAKKD